MAADSVNLGPGPGVGESHGPGVFTDEEFEKMAREVVAPDLTGFEFFVESHGTKFYRKYREVLRNRVACVTKLCHSPNDACF